MPILFLYRHYLEIALKDALDRSKVFDLSQSEEKFGHDLIKLWRQAEPVLKCFVSPEWLEPIGKPWRYLTQSIGEPMHFGTLQTRKETHKCRIMHTWYITN
jgi:hypothetical protein